MHTSPARGRRRFPLALPGLVLVLVALAVPAAARAEEQQFCFGTTKMLAKTTERDTGVSYSFKCSQAIKAFALTNATKLSAFDVSADVFDPPELGGGIRGDDRFGECEGSIPGFGFTCSGTYQGFSRLVSGSYDTSSDQCARDRHGHLKSRAMLVVENASGKLSGPYGLGKPQGCPKPRLRRARGPGRPPGTGPSGRHRPAARAAGRPLCGPV